MASSVSVVSVVFCDHCNMVVAPYDPGKKVEGEKIFHRDCHRKVNSKRKEPQIKNLGRNK